MHHYINQCMKKEINYLIKQLIFCHASCLYNMNDLDQAIVTKNISKNSNCWVRLTIYGVEIPLI